MGVTTPSGCVATVQKFMELNIAGDLEAGSRLLSDDFVAHEAPGLPYGGEYHGRAGFLELLGKIGSSYDLTPVTIFGVFDAADDRVVLLSRLRFTGRPTGKSAEVNVCELFAVRDGQIVDLDIYYKDPEAVTALLF